MLRTKHALTVGIALLALSAPATAASNPYERGPEPSVTTLRSATGFYTIKKTGIPDAGTPGFGSASVWSPTNAPEGQTFGGIAVSPGLGGTEMTWLGPRLASQGFVVITYNTQGLFDLPDSRATQLNAALNYLKNTSPARALVDSSRLAVMGHSMGGGGALIAAKRNPNLKAVVGMAAFEFNKSFSTVTTPTMLLGGENDFVASIPSHSLPFYNSIPSTTPKALAEINNGDHYTFLKPHTATATASLAWLKRYVDSDTRYTKFLKPFLQGPPAGSIKSYRWMSIS